MKTLKFELQADGSVKRVDSCLTNQTVEATNKTEAIAKFMQFAFRALENQPRVKIQNGAYQLAYESLNYGVSVEAGREGRKFALCCSGVSDWSALNDSTASFDYYAGEQYQNVA